MDNPISFHDEAFNSKHRDVLLDLSRDQPTPLELRLQTARVYAEIAEQEFRSGYLDEAKNAQTWAMRSYQAALELVPSDSDVALRNRLASIRHSLDRNTSELGLE